jgi:DNA-binding CsgD family transcriptional regulator
VNVHLTDRQRQVIATILDGHTTNGQLAATLGISRKTVYNHLESIQKKTGTRNLAEIILWCWRNGWEIDMQHEHDGIAKDEDAAKHAIERLLSTIINVMEGHGVSPGERQSARDDIEAIIEKAMATVGGNGK